ncbi:MAG: hypothetical protein KDK65_06000 [Chlamydiia bacterium]|nr:hypothetical protein [Chlamydiia bacterium]
MFGPIVIPATFQHRRYNDDLRNSIRLDQTDWRYKRVTLSVDGMPVDGMIVTRDATKANGKWFLKVNGNGEHYEEEIEQRFNNVGAPQDLYRLLHQTEGNALFFNYPGVGSSGGSPSYQTLIKAHEVALRFLEEELQAKQIVGLAHSIGTGVQSEALKTHKFKEGIDYTFIRKHPFSSTAAVVPFLLRPFVSLLGWNLINRPSLGHRQIIIQAAKVPHARIIDKEEIEGDGVISAYASLIKSLRDRNITPINTTYIGMGDMRVHTGGRECTHNAGLTDDLVDVLVTELNKPNA